VALFRKLWLKLLPSTGVEPLNVARPLHTSPALDVASERGDAMEQQMIVIVPADERVLQVLCEMLRDAGYDALILESTALEQQVQPDRQHLMTNTAATLKRPRRCHPAPATHKVPRWKY
jgi:hypothetical protein